jgi:hypothetical protein
MVAMTPQKLDSGEYLTVLEAVERMGCSEAWVRTLLGRGLLPGARRVGQRVWLIPTAAADKAKDDLTTRAKGKRHLAKRPAAKRKSAKKAGRRKK